LNPPPNPPRYATVVTSFAASSVNGLLMTFLERPELERCVSRRVASEIEIFVAGCTGTGRELHLGVEGVGRTVASGTGRCGALVLNGATGLTLGTSFGLFVRRG
jgi:hypothetical protein